MKNVIMHVIFFVLKSYINTTALFHESFNTIIINYNLIVECNRKWTEFNHFECRFKNLKIF